MKPRHRHPHWWHAGARLQRQIFAWFAVTIAVTAALVFALLHLFGHQGSPRIVALIGVLVFALWLAAGRVARRIAWPILQISETARCIGQGDLQVRVRLGPPWRRRALATEPIGRTRDFHIWGELATLGHAIDDMAARLERQMADQRELLAAVSHELRTPIGHARLVLDLLETQEELLPNAKTRKALTDLARELADMDALAGQLLAQARLDFTALDLRSLDPVRLAVDALERAGIDAARLDGELSEGMKISGDPTLLGRALGNLLDNAARHGGRVVALRLRHIDPLVWFEVDDDGPGFAEGQAAIAFEKFQRRKGGGLGLGLALVERIAAAHGGQVRAENRQGGGARVAMGVTPCARLQPPHLT